MSINCIAIGQRIRAIRKKQGLTQFALAERIDRSPTYISCMENGIKCMSLDTFVMLANALNISADELLVDNLENTIRVTNHSFATLLADCSDLERRVLLDIAVATKASLRENKGCHSSHR